MTSIYAFTTSDADGSAADILRVMGQISETLDRITQDVANLQQEWVGSESELYTEINERWREGATNIKSILGEVSGNLSSINQRNTQLRNSVANALHSMDFRG